jgi:hypothetical protein
LTSRLEQCLRAVDPEPDPEPVVSTDVEPLDL